MTFPPIRFFSILLLLALSLPSGAHELRPPVTTIDLTQAPQAELEIKANLEALLAGIGTRHRDTDDAPEADRYRELRALPPADLEARARSLLPDLLSEIQLKSDQAIVPLELRALNIPADPDTARARTSRLVFALQLPAGSKTIHWQWPQRLGDNVLRVRLPGQEELHTEWLPEGQAASPITIEGMAEPSGSAVFTRYLGLGFTHIVPLGMDHILFVLGLFLFSTRWRPLLYQVTAFTLAHTLTLGLSIYGILSLPAEIVEPLIAASIVFVAVENIVSRKLHAIRVVVVFAFGLLHGLGFAGVLTELGLPQSQYLTALLSFNLGVEFGQLAVITGAFLVVLPWLRRPDYHRIVVVPASLVIAAIGSWWTIERVFL